MLLDMIEEKSPSIAITGASGFLGSALCSYFSKSGWHVVALVRNRDKYIDTASVTYFEYDIRQSVNPEVLKKVDYLVHAAYIKHEGHNTDAYAANIKGAGNLLAASKAAGLSRNIFISSMSSHDDAVSTYGKQKLAIEKLFNGKQDVSLRLGLIVGNGGIVHNMAAFMKSKHVVPLIGGGRQPIQIVGVDNIGEAIQAVIRHEATGVLTIATPQIYSYKRFYEALRKYLGIRAVFIPIPFWLLLGAVRLINTLRIPLAVNSDSVLGLKNLQSVDNKGDLDKLGVRLDDLKTSLRKSHIII